MKPISNTLRGIGSRLLQVAGYRRLDPHIPLPPKRLRNRVGRGDYRGVGREFFGIFTREAGLQPSARVLDIGCGAGRMAAPIARFLRPPGRYDGFDLDSDLVSWCQSRISSAYPHFRFRHVDVRSQKYNPGGTQAGADFRFPYDSDSFDFAIAISLFTHLIPPIHERYVSEVSRVLAPGGTLVATFFLLNDETKGLLAGGKSALPFRPGGAIHSVLDPGMPEAAVAYDETHVRELLVRRHLGLVEPVRFGSWCGRTAHLSYQDVIVAKKG